MKSGEEKGFLKNKVEKSEKDKSYKSIVTEKENSWGSNDRGGSGSAKAFYNKANDHFFVLL